MANELERLRALNHELQLVPKGTTVDELERNASAFTNAAAKMLAFEGWRRILKTVGKNVDGLDIDKLVNVDTFECRDIVISAGASNATVGWLDAGRFTDASRFVAVWPELKPSPPPSPPPVTAQPIEDEMFDAIKDLVVGRDETNRQLDRVATALEAIAAVLVSAGKRFGL